MLEAARQALSPTPTRGQCSFPFPGQPRQQVQVPPAASSLSAPAEPCLPDWGPREWGREGGA